MFMTVTKKKIRLKFGKSIYEPPRPLMYIVKDNLRNRSF